MTAYSIQQEEQNPKNSVHIYTLDPEDIMVSLHKHKMAACDSMLGDLISTGLYMYTFVRCYLCVLNCQITPIGWT